MDGTFIPLEGNEQNQTDLRELQSELEHNHIALMYVTGRHLELVLDAVQTLGLPSPPWMICDVGASIYQKDDDGKYVLLDAYQEHLGELVGSYSRDRIEQTLGKVSELQLQEAAKQSCYKISYYCNADALNELTVQIDELLKKTNAPYRTIASVDPFTGRGLIDLLPIGSSKAYALQWWANRIGIEHKSIAFAGDSGNDLAALTAGYRSIVVGNADDSLVQAVQRAHDTAGWTGRLVIAKAHATSGVLEGIRCFLETSAE